MELNVQGTVPGLDQQKFSGAGKNRGKGLSDLKRVEK